ncbi:MAG TPA: polynucleotide adenylyltransferase [Opitutaceae bacterium]|jgi:tRNA nucleotidyltransferase (CCA-adding enzyme)
MDGAPALPADLREMLEAARLVGRPRLVGGGVRDLILGLPAKDHDVEVAGVGFDALRRALARFGPTDVVGRSFGVVKVRGASGAEYDFSLPRRESKTGAGHRGFAVEADPTLSDRDAAARRDFTLNAISMDPFTGEIIDPLGGRADLGARVLRHAGPGFAEDPLRVLRAFQFAGRFDLTLAPETAALCRSILGTYPELPAERVWGEWDKWASLSVRPSRGLAVLEETGWIAHFPEAAALRGTPQEPDWHPEGDVMTHTALCLDALAGLGAWTASGPSRRRMLALAVLAHDFGKPSTTARAERRGALRWVSPGHEAAGAPLAEAFLRRIGAPGELDAPVCALVASHLAHHAARDGAFTDAQVRRLARRLAPATIDDLSLVMTADAMGRPPLPPGEALGLVGRLRERALALALRDAAPRPIIQGRHLVALGRRPGPEFRPILDAAFEAQLDGAFTDEAGGLTWLTARAP